MIGFETFPGGEISTIQHAIGELRSRAIRVDPGVEPVSKAETYQSYGRS